MMDREATAAVELLASPDTAWNVTALFQCSRGVAAALREAVRGPVEGNVLVDLLTLRCSLLSRLSRIQPADRVDPFLEQCLQSFHMLLTRVPALPHMMAMRDFAAAHEVRAMVNPTDMQSNQVAVNTMQVCPPRVRVCARGGACPRCCSLADPLLCLRLLCCFAEVVETRATPAL